MLASPAKASILKVLPLNVCLVAQILWSLEG